MSTDLNPNKIDIARFAKTASGLSGVTPLGDMKRLVADLLSVPRVSDSAYGVRWEAKGFVEGEDAKLNLWLAIEAAAVVPQICQRCLGLVDFPISFLHRFRFVKTEQEAEEQDEHVDEDLLVLTKHLDVIELIEDELLMAMPLIPVHEQCPETLPHHAIDPDFTEMTERPNAFGVLVGLKRTEP